MVVPIHRPILGVFTMFQKKNSLSKLFIVIVAMFAMLTISALAHNPKKSPVKAVVVKEDIPELPAADGSSDTPEMEVTMIDGKKVKLSSLRGRVCVIDMFASTCPHCQDHAPHMSKIFNQYKAQGMIILGLATDKKDDAARVKKFIVDYGVSYPVGFLSSEVLAYYADSHNHSVPQVVMFGKNGKMIKRWIGWSEANTKELTTLTQTALGGTAPAPSKLIATKTASPTRRKK
jgi:peroxiredoxin